MVTDPIADFITRIKNAGKAHKESIVLPFSKIKEAIANVLVTEGYLKSAAKKKNGMALEVFLNYVNNSSKVKEVQRISKSSCRVYKGFAEIHPPRGGAGRIILSTPKGILTDRQAIKEKVGGEVLFKIW